MLDKTKLTRRGTGWLAGFCKGFRIGGTIAWEYRVRGWVAFWVKFAQRFPRGRFHAAVKIRDRTSPVSSTRGSSDIVVIVFEENNRKCGTKLFSNEAPFSRHSSLKIFGARATRRTMADASVRCSLFLLSCSGTIRMIGNIQTC